MIFAVLYIFSVVGANALLSAFGLVPIGFGLVAPAGVYSVGFTLLLRDYVQERYNVKVALVLVVVGGFISAFMSPSLAFYSTLAFIASELLDTLVYSRFRATGWLLAVWTSNIASAILDSVIFLLLVFSSLDFVEGQIVGKLYATAFYTVTRYLIQSWRTTP